MTVKLNKFVGRYAHCLFSLSFASPFLLGGVKKKKTVWQNLGLDLMWSFLLTEFLLFVLVFCFHFSLVLADTSQERN